MTTITPAPMSAERLEEVRNFIATLDKHPYPSVKFHSNLPTELLSHIDALTARIAELTEDLRIAREYGDAQGRYCDELLRDAAARKPPEDGEVAALQKRLTAELILGWGGSAKAITDIAREMSDLLARQAAALKEALRVKNAALEEATFARNAAVTARRDALEEAVMVVYQYGVGDSRELIARKIRTLQQKDTTP